MLPRNRARSSGNQQRGEDSGHEEDERVQQGEDAEASGGLLEQIERETQRGPRAAESPAGACMRVT